MHKWITAMGLSFLWITTAIASDIEPAGGELQVNTYTTDEQMLPSVGVSPSGDFVVFWESLTQFGSFGQRYDSEGNRLGSEFALSTGSVIRPQVAMLPSGGFVGVWEDGDGYGDLNRCRASAHNSGTTSRKCRPRNQREVLGVAYLACKYALGGKTEVQV